MTIVEHKWWALPVPRAMQVLDRIPKQRDDDPELDARKAELVLPRVWQMARPLEL